MIRRLPAIITITRKARDAVTIMERMDPAVIIMEKAETAAAITAVKNASCIQMNILYAGSVFCLWCIWLHTAGFNPRNYFFKSQSLQLALQGISKLGLKA